MKNILKKKVNVFGKGIPLFVFALLGMFIVSAALITNFALIETEVQVTQPINVNGEEEFTDTRSLSLYAGQNKLGEVNTITNDAPEDRNVEIISNDANYSGIDVKHYEILGYSEEFPAEETHFDNTNITVEDLGESVKWTLTVPQDASYGTGRGPGDQVAWSVSIGVGNEILYQVHNNDGTDGSYDNGEYLYSEYDNGWQTGSENTLVTEVDGIEATGEYVGGKVFTIKIDKDRLDVEEFEWVVYANYETDSLPNAFTWSDTDTAKFETATVGTLLTNPVTIPSNGEKVFVDLIETSEALASGYYTLITEVNPVV